jgi:hypothetical protein
MGLWRSLGARLNGIQKVRGSNPLSSTKRGPGAPHTRSAFFYTFREFPAAGHGEAKNAVTQEAGGRR